MWLYAASRCSQSPKRIVKWIVLLTCLTGWKIYHENCGKLVLFKNDLSSISVLLVEIQFFFTNKWKKIEGRKRTKITLWETRGNVYANLSSTWSLLQKAFFLKTVVAADVSVSWKKKKHFRIFWYTFFSCGFLSSACLVFVSGAWPGGSRRGGVWRRRWRERRGKLEERLPRRRKRFRQRPRGALRRYVLPTTWDRWHEVTNNVSEASHTHTPNLCRLL